MPTKILLKCPVCGRESYTSVPSTVEKGGTIGVQCSGCGMYFSVEVKR